MISPRTNRRKAVSEQNKATLRRFWSEVFNQRNLAEIDNLFTADYVYHGSAGQEVRGPQGLKQFLSIYFEAFPDIRAEIEDVIAEGDRVASRAMCRGTHKGSLMGIPPTNRPVTLTVICINRFEGGKIAEDWELVDFFGMMQQLGVMPAPG
jgi:steroid delta-isomerase-like uncharacterized protein